MVLPAHPYAQPGEVTYEHFDDDKVFLQRVCPACDHGLLPAPARWCPTCRGNGFLARVVPAGVTVQPGRRAPAETPAWRETFDRALKIAHERRQRVCVYRFDQRLANRGWVYVGSDGPRWFAVDTYTAVEIRAELRQALADGAR